MGTAGEGPSPLERWEQRDPANAQAVHGECTVELEKWERTLHGYPWRTTKGAAPCAVKVACTVLNGGDEETYRKATRLVPTQRECGKSYADKDEQKRGTLAVLARHVTLSVPAMVATE